RREIHARRAIGQREEIHVVGAWNVTDSSRAVTFHRPVVELGSARIHDGHARVPNVRPNVGRVRYYISARCDMEASTSKLPCNRFGRAASCLPRVISAVEYVRAVAESEIVECDIGSRDGADPPRSAVKNDRAPTRHAERFKDPAK